jgi:hypothetical protein
LTFDPFDPIHFALPAPRPFGIRPLMGHGTGLHGRRGHPPFYYKQYRVTFGVEIAL